MPGRGAVELGKLGVGTQIITRAGPTLIIASLVRHDYPSGILVYNFEVQNDHAYFVGTANGGIWVHNCGWTSPGGLEYETGSSQGNRVMHIFEHLAENTNKPNHSVFNVGTSGEALDLIDEAWASRGTACHEGLYTTFDVSMGRSVGTAGQTSIRIVVRTGTNKIITAYPIH